MPPTPGTPASGTELGPAREAGVRKRCAAGWCRGPRPPRGLPAASWEVCGGGISGGGTQGAYRHGAGPQAPCEPGLLRGAPTVRMCAPDTAPGRVHWRLSQPRRGDAHGVDLEPAVGPAQHRPQGDTHPYARMVGRTVPAAPAPGTSALSPEDPAERPRRQLPASGVTADAVAMSAPCPGLPRPRATRGPGPARRRLRLSDPTARAAQSDGRPSP